MAKSDRELTLDELLSGHFTEEYLDLKEQRAIVDRHLNRLCDDRDAMEDGMEIAPENPKFAEGLKKDLEKITKLQKQYDELTEKMKTTR